MGKVRRSAKRLVFRVTVSIGALAAALVHLLRPDLAIDQITLILLGIAVVPWLGVLFESVEMPWFKVKYWQEQLMDVRARLETLDESSVSPAGVPSVQAAHSRLLEVVTNMAEEVGQRTSPEMRSFSPLPFVLPERCQLVQPVVNLAGATEFKVDCGEEDNRQARATMGEVLEKQGWSRAQHGLAHAVWEKDGRSISVSEPADPKRYFFLNVHR